MIPTERDGKKLERILIPNGEAEVMRALGSSVCALCYFADKQCFRITCNDSSAGVYIYKEASNDSD